MLVNARNNPHRFSFLLFASRQKEVQLETTAEYGLELSVRIEVLEAHAQRARQDTANVRFENEALHTELANLRAHIALVSQSE